MPDVEVPILPPGPSEEFLRRQAMYEQPQTGIATAGSYDPTTGITQGRSFQHQVVPPSTSEMQMLESIRQQVNAMHFKNAQDALNASIQFQHMREAQRMREAGASDQQIWSRLGRGLVYANPNVLPSMTRELTTPPEPQVIDRGGIKILRSGLKGERAVAVQQSAIPKPDFEAKVRTIDGHQVVQLGPNHYQYLGKENQDKAVPPSVLERIYTHEISDAKEALDELPDNNKPDTVAKRTALQQQITDSRAKRRAITGATESAAPAAAAIKKLDKALALDFLKQAAGDKEKARKLARDAGYEF